MRLRLALLTCFVLTSAACAASATAHPRANPADRLADLPIDDYGYDHARDCRKRPMPGALALVEWLERNARGEFWGIMRCERWGKGRASCTPRAARSTGTWTPAAPPTAARRAG